MSQLMCSATARLKVRLPDKETAERALEDARARRGRRRKGRVEQRVYECDACGDWHLTSQK
jgi:hypothetical protein